QRVGAEIGLAVAVTDRERSAHSGADQDVWIVAEEDGDREGAVQARQNGRDGFARILPLPEPMGDEMAQMIAGSALQSPDAVKGAVQAFEAVGVDEFILDPTTSDPDQVDKLAEVVF
ncbi:MAG: hypothetical protein KY393_00700, partial [Actinobacteria bacterium]|nr:hypothetical protein [Actinomycetota bacterium]